LLHHPVTNAGGFGFRGGGFFGRGHWRMKE
jgi:hypothetical protein